jgi:UDP-glucose 6-dehydrogenase
VRWSKALNCSELGLRSLESRREKRALFGPEFKPNTDDVQEASPLKIAKALLEAEARVSAFDPVERKCRSPDLKCSNAQLDPGLSVRCACRVVATESEQIKPSRPPTSSAHGSPSWSKLD